MVTIQCSHFEEKQGWDRLAAQLDGGFFHCHAFATYEAACQSDQPLFVRAFERGVCVGVAVGLIRAPRRWPFSTLCREAVFTSLPATRARDKDLEAEILAAMERRLRSDGIYRISIESNDSPNATDVLSRSGYQLRKRCELYLDLTRTLDQIWDEMEGKRRTDIRKATKTGVRTCVENTSAGLRWLGELQEQSLHRRGVEYSFDEQFGEHARTLLDAGAADVLVSRVDEVENSPVNAALIGFFGGRGYYVKSGSSPLGFSRCGPAHLLWTAIGMLKAKGCTVLNLGGTPPPDDPAGQGLFRFKNGFNPTVVAQPAGTKELLRSRRHVEAARSLLKRARSAAAGPPAVGASESVASTRGRLKWFTEALVKVKRRAALRSRTKSLIHSVTDKHRFGLKPLQNLLHDARWGGFYGGVRPSRFADSGAAATQSTNYEQLRELFGPDNSLIGPADVLVDVGCGKGRVLNFWLSLGLKNRIVGIELDPNIAEETRRRLAPYANVVVLCGDAIDRLPLDGTLFYLYNPFNRAVMSRFKSKLAGINARNVNVKVVYYNCRHLDVFQDDPDWATEGIESGDDNPAALIRGVARNPPTAPPLAVPISTGAGALERMAEVK